MVTHHILCRRVRLALSSVEAAVLFFGMFASASHAQRRVVAARMIDATNEVADSTDTGAVPVSQPMHLTLRLAPTPERQAALDQLLAAQTTPSSPTYHHWLTPQQFAATYGATDEQIVVANDARASEWFPGYSIVPDEEAGLGPLAGIRTSIPWARRFFIALPIGRRQGAQPGTRDFIRKLLA